MLTTDRIRQILEGRGCTVDITCEPFGSVQGFVSFHKTGYPARKAIVHVLERFSGLYKTTDDKIVERIARSIRDLEKIHRCQERPRSKRK